MNNELFEKLDQINSMDEDKEAKDKDEDAKAKAKKDKKDAKAKREGGSFGTLARMPSLRRGQ